MVFFDKVVEGNEWEPSPTLRRAIFTVKELSITEIVYADRMELWSARCGGGYGNKENKYEILLKRDAIRGEMPTYIRAVDAALLINRDHLNSP
jgi:hypothetical protein